MADCKVEMVVGGASTGCVLVDGQDVSALVRAVYMSAEVGDPPVVTLDLTPRRVRMELQGRAAVDVATHDLLVALGWSAPPLEHDVEGD